METLPYGCGLATVALVPVCAVNWAQSGGSRMICGRSASSYLLMAFPNPTDLHSHHPSFPSLQTPLHPSQPRGLTVPPSFHPAMQKHSLRRLYRAFLALNSIKSMRLGDGFGRLDWIGLCLFGSFACGIFQRSPLTTACFSRSLNWSG